MGCLLGCVPGPRVVHIKERIVHKPCNVLRLSTAVAHVNIDSARRTIVIRTFPRDTLVYEATRHITWHPHSIQSTTRSRITHRAKAVSQRTTTAIRYLAIAAAMPRALIE